MTSRKPAEKSVLLGTVSPAAVFVLLVSLWSTAAAEHAPNPQAVQEVMAGVRTEASAAWWGFDPEDSTEFLQAAISSGVARLIIPDMGEDWVVTPLTLRSNLELVFEDGAVVAAKKGKYHGANDSVFNARDVENLIIHGYGGTIRMHKDDYDNRDLYEKAEWRMGISIRGSRNVEIAGLTIRDTGGDGIYLGRGHRIPTNENVVIRDIVADNNYRQGISVITAKNLLIENSIFKNTGGTAPAAGIDLEPNHPDELLDNIIVRNSVFEGNSGAGITVYLNNMREHSHPVSVLFENILIRQNSTGIAWNFANITDKPKGEVIVRNCIVEDTPGYGLRVRNHTSESMDLIFDGCTFYNVAMNPDTMPVRLEGEDRLGSVKFQDVIVVDGVNRPTVYGLIRSPQGEMSSPSVRGELSVISPYGPRIRGNTKLALTASELDSTRLIYNQVVRLAGYERSPLKITIEPVLQVTPMCIASDNLLQNPGFEMHDGSTPVRPLEWAIRPPDASEDEVRLSMEAAQTGDWGIRMKGDGSRNYYIQQYVPIEGGKTYELSAWMKAIQDGGGAYGRLKMEFWRNEGGTNHWEGEASSPLFYLWNYEDWNTLQLQARAPEGADRVGLLVRFYGRGEINYDNISFQEISCGL